MIEVPEADELRAALRAFNPQARDPDDWVRLAAAADTACKKLVGSEKENARLKRANQRQGEEIVAMMNRQWSFGHEIEKLERALLETFKHPEHAQKIARDTIRRRIEKMEGRMQTRAKVALGRDLFRHE